MDALLPVIGQVARTVTPNPKCQGCMHYDSQRGRTGICEIGLSPSICGDGVNPTIGYAPMTTQGPTLFDVHAPNAGTPQQGPMPVAAIRIMVLGEEHANMVKSEYHRIKQENACRSCSEVRKGTVTQFSINEGCKCKPVKMSAIVETLEKSLSNFELAVLGDQKHSFASTFVRGVLSTKNNSLDDIKKALCDASVNKGIYGDDWLSQFRGTELFDDAHSLAVEELKQQEENLARRIKRDEQAKVRAAHMAKLRQEDEGSYGWEAEDRARQQLNIKKQKLLLQLAKVQQKNLASTKVEKSIKAPGMDVSRQAMERTHAVHSGSRPAADTRKMHLGASKLHAMAAKVHRQNGNKEMAQAHQAVSQSHGTMAAARTRKGHLDPTNAVRSSHSAALKTLSAHISKTSK